MHNKQTPNSRKIEFLDNFFDMIMTLLLFIPVGICMGLTAGLFGIGGGMFAVPFMVIIFENSGYSGTPIPQMAVVTAMAITSCTTLISAQTHRKLHREVMLRNIKKIVAGLMLGSFLGTLTLVNISGELVKIFVSILLLWVGTSFLSSHANDRTVFLRHIPLPFWRHHHRHSLRSLRYSRRITHHPAAQRARPKH